MRPQPVILPEWPTRSKRRRPVLPLLAPIEPAARHAEMPIRRCHLENPDLAAPPHSISLCPDNLPTYRSLAASATLNQGRRHSKPLDTLQKL